ncbi:MAG: T9SS type A sorting domain-containing protein [Bacteroidetes bacterium]|nr:T9SS type A sorting domain-containing protein [Bacteroidota bacterium]
MKTQGNFWRLFSIIALVAVAFPATSQEIIVNPALENRLNITSSDYNRMEAINTIGEAKAFPVLTDRGQFTRVIMTGYSPSLTKGWPELPVKRELIEIPAGAIPEIRILESTFTEIDLALQGYPDYIYPSQPPRIKSQDEHELFIQEQAYLEDRFFSEELVSVDILGYLRSVRVARLNIAPVQYNPVTGILRVYDKVHFEIIFRNADLQATQEIKNRLASPFFESIYGMLPNYKPAQNRENLTKYPVKYVFISDRMFEAQLQPLIEWKTKKGFTVIEAYTDNPAVGNSTASIKNYIQGLYNAGTPEDPAPSFIVFVGDIQQIPAWSNGNGATDRNYCEFTGDLLPEIFYGRFSAQNTNQLQPYIDKTLQYEMYTMPDPSYLDEVVMVAGMDSGHGHDWANGQINYGTINYFNEAHNLLSHTYLYPESGSHSADIIQNISDGVSYGNYTAHCSPAGWSDPSFEIPDIATLQNQDQYCLLVGNCCQSSQYDDNECFAEAIVRAANKGAVGYIGGSNSTYWDEDYYWGVGVGEISENPPPYEETTLGMYDRAFHDHGEPFGDWFVTGSQMIFAGNLAVQEGVPGSAEYYWDIYNMMGDPSLTVYFSEPPLVEVEYIEMLPLSSTTFVVNTEPYAYVAISRDGVLHGAKLADEDGLAEMEILPFQTPGDADVIVTLQNREPFIGTVLVANPEGAYLLLNDYIIEDSLGNNNHVADYDELVCLTVALENLGNSDALNASATITSSDPNIILTDNFQEWGSVPAHGISWQDNAFTFMVQEVIEDQHVVEFEMTMEAGAKETWTTDLSIILNAPVLSILEMAIDDSQYGNGNGRLDPGETANIKIKNKNTGHCSSSNAIGTLVVNSPYMTFDNLSYDLGVLGLLGHKYAIFTVHVDPEAPNGVIIANFDYTVTAGPYQASKNFRQKIGLIYDDFETGNFNKFPWQLSGNAPWTITSEFPYEGIYSAKSGLIGDGQTSVLSLQLNVMTADTIYFVRKVSSQANQDKLKFYVDNTMQAEWSGTTQGWKNTSIAAPAGVHTFKWIYQKDGQGSAGSDCAWLDFVVMPPIMTLTCYAGPDGLNCETAGYQCSGQATMWQTVEWTTSGSGTFSDPTMLNPVYSPSEDDVNAGSVILTLTANGTSGGTTQDKMTLTFISTPEVPSKPAGPDVIDWVSMPACHYETQAVAFASLYEWSLSPAEAGTISGNGSICRVEWSQVYSGLATIKVKAINQCGESEYSEGLTVTVNNPVGISTPDDEYQVSISPNPNNGNFTIEFSSDRKETINVMLFNSLGVKLYHFNYKTETGANTLSLGLGNLPAGLYFMTLESRRGKSVEKLIIKK